VVTIAAVLHLQETLQAELQQKALITKEVSFMSSDGTGCCTCRRPCKLSYTIWPPNYRML
jgi:hypothetical protein